MEYLQSIYLPTFGESWRFWRQNQRIWYCSKQLKSILTKTVAASFISELKCHDYYYFLLFLLKKTCFWSVEYFNSGIHQRNQQKCFHFFSRKDISEPLPQEMFLSYIFDNFPEHFLRPSLYFLFCVVFFFPSLFLHDFYTNSTRKPECFSKCNFQKTCYWYWLCCSQMLCDRFFSVHLLGLTPDFST